MIAAQRDTSVSALVKRFLAEFAGGDSEAERATGGHLGAQPRPQPIYRSEPKLGCAY
jgi:hypothetical protein